MIVELDYIRRANGTGDITSCSQVPERVECDADKVMCEFLRGRIDSGILCLPREIPVFHQENLTSKRLNRRIIAIHYLPDWVFPTPGNDEDVSLGAGGFSQPTCAPSHVMKLALCEWDRSAKALAVRGRLIEFRAQHHYIRDCQVNAKCKSFSRE